MGNFRKINIVVLVILLLLFSFPSNISADKEKINPFEDEINSYENKISLALDDNIKNSKQSKSLYSNNQELDNKDNYIVEFDKSVELSVIANILNGFEYKMIGPISVRTFKVTCKDLDNFLEKGFPWILSFEKDSLVTIENTKTMTSSEIPKVSLNSSFIPNDPLASSQWAIDNMNLTQAWSLSKGSNLVRIAVIDSGINAYHEDFAGTKILNGWDFISNDVVLNDQRGHGTMVSGVIGATPDNGIGIAGICSYCTILPLKVFGESDLANNSDVIEAIYFAAELDSDVINLSLGSDEYSVSQNEAIQYALSKGCIIIAAAGNSGDNSYSYPASFEGVISVAAHTKQNTHATYSTYNSEVDVSAPGSAIHVTTVTGGYGTVNGTSFAAPQLSGVAALALALEPSMTLSDFYDALIQTSNDLGDIGYDQYFGFGAIDAGALLQFIKDDSSYNPPAANYQTIIKPESFTMTDMEINEEGYYYNSYTFTPDYSGTYTFTAQSAGDSDIYIYDNSTDELLDYDIDESMFWLSIDLEEGKSYEVLIRNFGDDEYYYHETTFVVSTPTDLTGVGVVIDSNGVADHWSQSMGYNAESEGRKAILIQPKYLSDLYSLDITDSNNDIVATWDGLMSGSKYFSFDGVIGENRVNLNIGSDYNDTKFHLIFEDISKLTNGTVITETLDEGDSLTGAEFTAPKTGVYRFGTDQIDATIEFIDYIQDTGIYFPSNTCDVYILQNQSVDFFIHTDGTALTQNLSIRQLSDVALLESIQVSDGLFSPEFNPLITDYTVELGSYKETLSLLASSGQSSTIEINGVKRNSIEINPFPGETMDIRFIVTSEDGLNEKLYTVSVHRPSDEANFISSVGESDNLWIHESYPLASFYVNNEYNALLFNVSEGASWSAFIDFECTTPITPSDPKLQYGINHIYAKIVAENSVDFKVWSIIINMKGSSGESVFDIAMLKIDGRVLELKETTNGNVILIPFGTAPFSNETLLNKAPFEINFFEEISTDGIYEILAKDSNETKIYLEFIIDKIPPLVTGVNQGYTYYKPVNALFIDCIATLNDLPYSSGEQITDEGEHTIYIIDNDENSKTITFNIHKRVIDFNTNGGSELESIKGFDETLIFEPEAPTLTGYIFDGWYKNAELTNAWDFETDRVSESATLFAKWAINQYTITFDTDGGNLISPIIQDYDTQVFVPVDPTKEGYTFDHWDIPVPGTMPSENITITAVWAINIYTVEFKDWDGDILKTENVNYKSSATAPENPIRTGYAFSGWDVEFEDITADLTVTAQYITAYIVSFYDWDGTKLLDQAVGEGESAIPPEDPIRTGYTFIGWDKSFDNITADLILNAQYEINFYEIIFDSQGGSLVTNISTQYDTTITPPTEPTRTGYTFIGWYKEANRTNEWDFNTEKVISDTTLYAKWLAKEYTITWMNNGDLLSVDTFLYDSLPIYSGETPIKENDAEYTYTFIGWTPEISIVTGDAIYTALFDSTINSYTVTFNSQGGSEVTSATADYNTTILSPTVPTRSGYAFGGWFKEAECINIWDFMTDTITENISLYGKWGINSYTITFDTDGGTLINSITQDYATEVTVPLDPTKEGYIFDGWDKSIPDTMPAEDMTIAALWTTNTYTVIFKDWDDATISSQTVSKGESAIPPENPARVGYTFTGWDNSLDNITADLILNAQYEINYYDVTFDSQGGSSVTNISTQYNTFITPPAEPTRLGYTFIGWYKEANGTNEWEFSLDKVKNNTTLYAKWKAKYIKGDITGDGKVDALDLLKLKKYLLGQIVLSENELLASDVTGDGKVDALDLLKLKKYLLGQITLE